MDLVSLGQYLFQDVVERCQVMVTVEDKTPPVAQDPQICFGIVIMYRLLNRINTRVCRCKDHDYATDNAKDGTCIDSKRQSI
ncbi:MAG: hypothetical protein IPP42_01585 [Saprospiraceae bacterium]|nr:hypothetical protein [Saprospiraceae bacterium]